MNNRNIKPISPFVLFCQKVIPLAFDESMSYYECLCALVNYLYNEVVPAVNNNADAVTELQNYVKNYFDNLDVQEEINNKLDEMAESGQLTDIIAQYLNLAGVLGYNTVNDMINASNLVNGSFARTYGLNTYNDGKGAFYKIRTVTTSDVIDGVNIIAVNFSDTLIAEKMPDYYINEINNKINTIITNNQTISNLVIISDSYGVGNSYPSDVTSYATYMKNYLGLNNDTFYNNSYGGCGFAYANNNKRFIDLVNECNNDLSTDRKNNISHVLFAGGFNDQYSSESDVKSYIASTISRAHEVFPNAQIYVAFIGWNNSGTNFVDVERYWNEGTNQTKYGKYIINSQNILTGDLISGDNTHPNENGYIKIAKNLVNGLQVGACYPSSTFQYLKDNSDNILGVVQMNNNTLTFEMYDLEYTGSGTANGNEITYCTLADDSMLNGKDCRFITPCMFVHSNNYQYVAGYCVWHIHQKSVKLAPICLKSDGTNYFDYTNIRFIHTTFNIDHKFI